MLSSTHKFLQIAGGPNELGTRIFYSMQEDAKTISKEKRKKREKRGRLHRGVVELTSQEQEVLLR